MAGLSYCERVLLVVLSCCSISDLHACRHSSGCNETPDIQRCSVNQGSPVVHLLQIAHYKLCRSFEDDRRGSSMHRIFYNWIQLTSYRLHVHLARECQPATQPHLSIADLPLLQVLPPDPYQCGRCCCDRPASSDLGALNFAGRLSWRQVALRCPRLNR